MENLWVDFAFTIQDLFICTRNVNLLDGFLRGCRKKVPPLTARPLRGGGKGRAIKENNFFGYYKGSRKKVFFSGPAI